VTAVEEAIDSPAAPSHVDDEVDPQRGTQATAVVQRDALERSALDVRKRRAIDAGNSRNV